MRHAWVALMLVGCEPMPSSGSPFEPVKVETASTLPVDAEPAGEPWFDDTPAVVISSEDMDAALEAEERGEPVPPLASAATDASAAEPVEVVAEPAGVPAAAAVSAGAPSMLPSQPMSSGMTGAALGVGAWPVRLVRTLPDTFPPRAILGLPDGREIVVTPGSMVPDQGLVVVAIGRETAQLAQVSAQGDHAAIQPLMLSAQY